MINVTKEDLICVLKNIVDALEDTNKIDVYKFCLENETQTIDTESQTLTRFTGWIKTDFSIRFHKIK